MPLPPKPSSAHARTEDAYASPEYAYKRRVVLQILKDWHVPYSTGRGSVDDSAPSAQEGHWNLNGEVLARQKGNDVAVSHRLVAAELEEMRKLSPFYSALVAVFLQDDVSHTTYDLLKIQATGDSMYREKRAEEQRKLAEIAAPKSTKQRGPSRELPTDGKTDSERLFDAVEIGIHQLTERLLDVDLYCVFPEAWKTERREDAEEKYLRLAKVFDRHCEELSKTRKRFRNRAYDATVAETGESRNTVGRAVHYRDNDPNHGQLARAKKHRNEKEKCPARAVTTRKTIKGTTERVGEDLMDDRLFHAAHGVVHPDAKLTEEETD